MLFISRSYINLSCATIVTQLQANGDHKIVRVRVLGIILTLQLIMKLA